MSESKAKTFGKLPALVSKKNLALTSKHPQDPPEHRQPHHLRPQAFCL